MSAWHEGVVRWPGQCESMRATRWLHNTAMRREFRGKAEVWMRSAQGREGTAQKGGESREGRGPPGQGVSWKPGEGSPPGRHHTSPSLGQLEEGRTMTPWVWCSGGHWPPGQAHFSALLSLRLSASNRTAPSPPQLTAWLHPVSPALYPQCPGDSLVAGFRAPTFGDEYC